MQPAVLSIGELYAQVENVKPRAREYRRKRLKGARKTAGETSLQRPFHDSVSGDKRIKERKKSNV